MRRHLNQAVVALLTVLLATFGLGTSHATEPPEPDGPYFGDGNLPPGCTTDSVTVMVFGIPVQRFTDDCHHMRVDLNGLDSTKIDVLIVPPASPWVERDLRAMRQSIEMWEAGISYLAAKMGLDWLAEGVEFNVFPGHPDDPVTTDPLWFPKIVVVSTNPVGGGGVGVDPLAHIFGATGPCHGVPNPAPFSMWEELPGFDSHHDGNGGTLRAECDNGGSVCFAVNAAIEPVPGLLNVFGLYDLVSHEVGHCLSVGHVGDALDHQTTGPPLDDIMSYAIRSKRKCVSTLDVEGFALRMSHFLLDEPLDPNDLGSTRYDNFQIQHRSEHYYASSTGAASDCPQPDLGIVPGERVSFWPDDGEA